MIFKREHGNHSTFQIDFVNGACRDIHRTLRENVNSQLFAEHARLTQERSEQRRRLKPGSLDIGGNVGSFNMGMPMAGGTEVVL
ncbi:MAG: hypothetical protein FWE05_13180 [Defluviitaleaceae bacterium]|nr:hypothetical protein [Defluviitaleaceae bacterium]